MSAITSSRLFNITNSILLPSTTTTNCWEGLLPQCAQDGDKHAWPHAGEAEASYSYILRNSWPVKFIADIRGARVRELEEKRINKEMANIRKKFKGIIPLS